MKIVLTSGMALYLGPGFQVTTANVVGFGLGSTKTNIILALHPGWPYGCVRGPYERDAG